MYLGKIKIENIDVYNNIREKCIKYKLDASYTAFSELDGLIDIDHLAKQYFNKSGKWLCNRVDMSIKNERLSEDGYHELAESFRNIAKRLNAHADEIDKAKMG